MPTFKQWGFTDVVNSVAILGTGAGYWRMTGAPGAAIELDFGYKVALKKIKWVVSMGAMGDYAVVGSNTAATGMGDTYVPANGDVRLTTYSDAIVQAGADYILPGAFSAGKAFDKKFRYYRLILIGPATPTTGPETAPVGHPIASDPAYDFRYQAVKLTDIQCDVAMVAKTFGYTTKSGLPLNMVDLDNVAGWTPYTTTFPDITDVSVLIDKALISTSPAGTVPAIEIDMGEAVILAFFTFKTTDGSTLPGALLYGSSNPASSTSNTLQPGDVLLGTYTQAQMNSAFAKQTLASTSGQDFRYYRFVVDKSALATAPNETAVLEYTPVIVEKQVYITADYDSIWGKGDRIANGLLTTNQSGLGTVFAPFSDAFDNNYGAAAGNGAYFGGGTPVLAGAYASFDLGGASILLKGLQWRGQADLNIDPGVPKLWAIHGGISHGGVMVRQHAVDAFSIDMSNSGNDFFQEVVCDAPLTISFPYFEIQSAITQNMTIGRFAEELWIKVAHSELDGGDRRTFGNKYVQVSTDFAIFHGTLNTLLNGEVNSQNRASFFNPADYVALTVSSTPGKFIKFEFPRKVAMHQMVLNTDVKEVYGAGPSFDPTKYGTWQWEGSDDDAIWTAVGSVWKFKDGCFFMLAPDPQPGDNQQFLLWRMSLVTGPAFGNTIHLQQFIFNLTDPGGFGTSLRVGFSDDGGLGTITTTIVAPTSAFDKVKFSDGDTDAFNITLTLKTNPIFSIGFTDDAEIDFFSDIFPSIIVQTMLHITGR